MSDGVAGTSGLSDATLRWIGLVLLGLGVLATVVFLTWPDIDLRVAGWFGTAEDGFGLRFHPIPRFFNELVNLLAGLSALFLLIGWPLSHRLGLPLFGLWPRQFGFLFGTLLIGPGLLANALFKENWGRARPRQLESFGGEAEFSPPLLLSDQCGSNCSFVSGDASLAFAFVALTFVVPKRYRAGVFISTLAFGCLIGAMRIIQGAHFLSDVLFAGVLVGLVMVGLYGLLLRTWRSPTLTAAPLSVQLGLRQSRNLELPPGKSRAWAFFRSRPQDFDGESGR